MDDSEKVTNDLSGLTVGGLSIVSQISFLYLSLSLFTIVLYLSIFISCNDLTTLQYDSAIGRWSVSCVRHWSRDVPGSLQFTSLATPRLMSFPWMFTARLSPANGFYGLRKRWASVCAQSIFHWCRYYSIHY